MIGIIVLCFFGFIIYKAATSKPKSKEDDWVDIMMCRYDGPREDLVKAYRKNVLNNK